MSGKIRIFSLGGLDEDGKNMTCIEVGDQIYVIEAGMKYPDAKESLGIEFIIPDFSYLIENKSRIAGVFITHAHDDVMGSLSYLLKQIHVDVYASPFTMMFIEKMIAEEGIRGIRLHYVDRHDELIIGGRKVIFFPVTHTCPGTFGLAIETKQGYVVYSGEFIEDYDVLSDRYRGDLTTFGELRTDGVLALLTDSKGADRSGHTSPDHRLREKFTKVLELNQGKLICISLYTQSVYWIQEVIEQCIKYNRKIVLYTEEARELVARLEKVDYDIPRIYRDYFLDPDMYDPSDKNVVIIITETGKTLIKLMSNICNNEVDDIEFRKDDIICMANPVLAGTDRDFKRMENDIYKEEGEIIALDKGTNSMHPAREDLKMMIFMTRPKYYIPIKGEYRKLVMNAEIGSSMGYDDDKIVILDNGQVATFEHGELVSCEKELELYDTLIDGKEKWDVAGVVLRDREILSTDGVIILAIGIDSRTKKIINGPDIQTRGLVYLKDAEYITGDVAKIMEETIEEDVRNRVYDNVETRQVIRERVSRYLVKTIAKRPMILPVILEINTSSNS